MKVNNGTVEFRFYKRSCTILFFVIAVCLCTISQGQNGIKYWNSETALLPRRIPFPAGENSIQRIDLDNDGDCDVLKYTIKDSIPIMWIDDDDDDDDMKWTDIEGDMDSDCLFVDKNIDGKFGGPWDLSIDWNDENNDGIADMQFLIQNESPQSRGGFNWDNNLMLIIDDEE